MPRKAALTLVPAAVPDAREAVLLRVKTRPRPDGLLQCPRCGCRTSVTLVNGAIVKDGRVQGGTVIEKHVCSECWRQGIITSMLPTEPRPATQGIA